MQTIIYIILPRKYTTVFIKTKKESADAIFRQIPTYKKFSFWQSLRHFLAKIPPPFTQRRLSGSLRSLHRWNYLCLPQWGIDRFAHVLIPLSRRRQHTRFAHVLFPLSRRRQHTRFAHVLFPHRRRLFMQKTGKFLKKLRYLLDFCFILMYNY